MPGILLVHGAFHGSWCWDDFAHHLTGRGHEVRAVQLRGHDRAPGRIWHRIRHYVEDVHRAATAFDEPPVLVGHSMGGLLVQRYVERNPAAGAVLMAPIPVGGTLAAVLRLGLRHPLVLLKVNLMWTLRPLITGAALGHELFFSPGTPRTVVDRILSRLQDESYPAFVQMVFAMRRRRRANLPVLVLGAEHDGFFTAGEMRRTARAYRTEAEIFPGMGHDMMFEDGWQNVANRVDGWVREKVTGRALPPPVPAEQVPVPLPA